MTSGDDPWLAAMRAHDFARGWEICDRHIGEVLACGVPKHAGPRHLQTIWRGEPLADRNVLVRCYHGLGDTIQFARFLRPLRRLARSVSIWAQLELSALIRTVDGVDRVMPLHDGTPEIDFDVDIEVMELAHALRVGADALGGEVPYLFPPPGRPHPAVLARRGTIKAGLVWEVGAWAPHRSIPPTALARLAVPGVTFFSLRPGAVIPPGSPVIDASSPSLVDLAATMRALDVIVTVDTMAAHLAGALGLRVFTLLSQEADWRWGSGSRSLWYPTIRLFRQTTPGDWSLPLAAVAGRLEQLVRGNVRQRTEELPR